MLRVNFVIGKKQIIKYHKSFAEWFWIGIRNNVTQSTMQTGYKYSPRLENYLLKQINTDITWMSTPLGEKVKSYVMKNGPCRSTHELLQIEGMNDDTRVQFCKSILTAMRSKVYKNKKQFLSTPHITNEARQNAKTILGIHVGYTGISWTLLDRNFNVLNWCYHMTTQESQTDILTVFNLVNTISAKLPAADIYILEECKTIRPNAVKNISWSQINQTVIYSFVIAHLARKLSIESAGYLNQNNVHILPIRTSARYFGLQLSSECTCTRPVMQQLLSGNTEEYIQNQINVPETFKDIYEKNSNIAKEEMSWSLLHSITFMELSIFQRCDFY